MYILPDILPFLRYLYFTRFFFMGAFVWVMVGAWCPFPTIFPDAYLTSLTYLNPSL